MKNASQKLQMMHYFMSYQRVLQQMTYLILVKLQDINQILILIYHQRMMEKLHAHFVVKLERLGRPLETM